MQGQKVAPGVKFYLAAASSQVEDEARQQGYWDTLVAAGASTLPPGCGPCIGLGEGVLEADEVAISATNRNFKGRMGSPQAQVYLASPAVVAASAIAGYISGVGQFSEQAIVGQLKLNPPRPRPLLPKIEITEGFPAQMQGELLFVPKDNMNTDAIFGKEFTYNDSLYLSPADMGSKAMLNYDPAFQKIAQEGDILVGGWNFGAGSSREQAATTLKYRGIQMVIAGSYSQIFKRNAFNNGYIVLECPELIEWLKNIFADDKRLTIRTGQQATIDFVACQIHCGDKAYSFLPLGQIAQKLVVLGGFENLIKEQLKQL